MSDSKMPLGIEERAEHTRESERRTTSARSLVLADQLAAGAAVLAALASAAGLLITGLYRDNRLMVAQAQGTDLVTLAFAVPFLAVGLWLARAGSMIGRLAALGGLGYLAYSYAIYSFSVVISPATPVHIAILGLALWSLLLTAPTLVAHSGEPRVGEALPRRITATFLLLVVVLFALSWLGQIAGAITTGILPAAVSDLNLPTSPVYTLDLAVVLPLLALAGVGLLRRDPHASAIALALLVFTVLMGSSIIALFVFEARIGRPIDPVVTGVFGAITVSALVLFAVSLLPRRSAGSAESAESARTRAGLT